MKCLVKKASYNLFRCWSSVTSTSTVKESHCCCSCSLKGSYIGIGVLILLGGIVGVYSTVGTVLFAEKRHNVLRLDVETRALLEEFYKVAYYAGMIQIPILVIWLIMSPVLLLGVQKNDPSLIKPWVIFSIYGTFLSVIINSIVTYFMFVYISAEVGWIALAAITLFACFGTYLIMFVHRYYLQLLDIKTEEPKDKF